MRQHFSSMKKLFLLIVMGFLLSNCSDEDPREKLVGEWKEYWGIGRSTDVDYHNINKIEITDDGQLFISCVNESFYKFDKIVFDGEELTFRSENTSDPKEKFYIYYKLKLEKEGKWMNGTILNSKNQTDDVKWEKMK